MVLEIGEGEGGGIVPDCPDVFGAFDDEVFVHCETAAGVLLRGELGHEILDHRAEGVSGGPDEEAVRETFEGFGAVWGCEFCFDGLVCYAFDHCFGFDRDGFFFEGRFRVVD